MKQIGNLALACARKNNVLFQILDGHINVHVGCGPDKRVLCANWNDDEKIAEIIYELNFGKYKADKVS
ncbi:MAG: hypothetical protein FWD71_22745 [Oscillospiraceae bacterium]|nr:hypothetical protein [Oscillospiraceae bacterium]